ncbi:MAG: SUMF1/EgtB/PvdO family nonheme iron enzyme [Chlorobaculum sp.]|jgi:formylglycine-generating enzyme required for sulfatase activity|nr:SUMF1/EgtB/PvdO family nonheme iron enzyme [Chlorobaculum sp.]
MAQEPIKILIASPSDVAEERKIAEEVINEWNIRNRVERGFSLDAVLWETHGAPESGERVQGILNRQFVDSCHCAIAIFWTRIGTDTGVAPGGAVEEVERLMSNGKPVMFYFSSVPISPDEIDPAQKQQLDAFKTALQKDVLSEKFTDRHEFRRKLTHHLDIQVRRWFCSSSEQDSDKSAWQSVEDLLCYQASLKEELGYIRILGLPDAERIMVNLNDDTFVPLRLSRRRDADFLPGKKPFQQEPSGEGFLMPDEVMRQAFRKRRMLLIIGDAGAGKTTLLKYYALSCLEGDRYKKLGFSSPVKVFYLPLRSLVNAERGIFPALPAKLSEWAARNQLTLTPDVFTAWLQSRSVLVLLDGLDEISDPELRKKACQWIDGAWRGFTNARFVVTSRGTGYRPHEGVELSSDYERADVHDFTHEQQERFLTNWFRAALLREPPEQGFSDEAWRKRQEAKAAERTAKILEHLKEEKNKGLRQIATIPMILQIMAILWKERDHLPKSRDMLYRAVLNYLLSIREQRRGINPPLTTENALMVLGPVSLWMQKELKRDEVDRSEMQHKMEDTLAQLDKPPSAEVFCDYLVQRSSLLVEYGGKEYLFRHKSFREYLAGVEFMKIVHRTTGYFDTLVEGFDDDWWSEPLRFFIAQSDADTFNLFMQRLFDKISDDTLQKRLGFLLTLVEEAPLKKVDALCEKLCDPANSAVRQRLLLDCLKVIGKPSALETLARFKSEKLARNRDVAGRLDEVIIASGEATSQRSVTVVSRNIDLATRPPFFYNEFEHRAQYILIPGKRSLFSFIGTKQSDLYFAKYPVTNRLYRRFIDYLQSKNPDCEALFPASEFRDVLLGIANNQEWDKGFAEYLKEGKNDLAGLFRSRKDEDRKFGGDDQPVVRITWYAARSYCLWLSLVESKGKNRDLYRLPEEPEWEYAAAGKERREYPWGNTAPNPKLANYDKSNIGATTPVGSYPEGATPEGLYDMAGNVWEWQESLYDNKKYPGSRALRGGSWLVGTDSLRCSSRDFYVPVNWGNNVGFRVVRPSPLLEP